MNSQTKTQLEHLFQTGEIIYTGDKYGPLSIPSSEFFVINPLHDKTARTNENVSVRRNFLMEFDSGDLEVQRLAASKLQSLGLNVATSTFSGSKSYHLILSMAETLNYDYRQTWIALAAEVEALTGLIADPSCKNEARLSRLAGATRIDTGLEQRLEFVGGFITNTKIAELITKHQIKASTVVSVNTNLNPDLTLLKFKLKLQQQEHRGLYSKLRGARLWAKPVNMYPELLKLTMWAIEATGVPKDTFIQYAQEKIYPHLLNVGYPPDKLDKAIHNAYDYKF